ncbi:hypothetical protein SAMN05216311_11794, partial [Chitinophaga sp. CF418]
GNHNKTQYNPVRGYVFVARGATPGIGRNPGNPVNTTKHNTPGNRLILRE